MCVIFSPDCTYSIRLLDKLQKLGDEKNIRLDFELIKKAITFAKKYHDGQLRKSGEPFYTHPLEVAYMASDYNLKTDIIVTSILHDVVEDSEATVGMIVDEFSWRIAEMVDMLTRDRPDGTKLSVETILNNAYEKNDNEVLLIKVLDRLHNMQTIGAKKPEKQKKTIDQTLKCFLVSALSTGHSHISESLYEKCININQHSTTTKAPYIGGLLLDQSFSLPLIPSYENNLH